jgi:hypothetical protein
MAIALYQRRPRFLDIPSAVESSSDTSSVTEASSSPLMLIAFSEIKRMMFFPAAVVASMQPCGILKRGLSNLLRLAPSMVEKLFNRHELLTSKLGLKFMNSYWIVLSAVLKGK